jgi:hypothetical protein
MIILLIIIWLALGIHSALFFIKRYTQKNDLTTSEIWMVVFSFLIPIVTHLSTEICYPNLKPKILKSKILKPKQNVN